MLFSLNKALMRGELNNGQDMHTHPEPAPEVGAHRPRRRALSCV